MCALEPCDFRGVRRLCVTCSSSYSRISFFGPWLGFYHGADGPMEVKINYRETVDSRVFLEFLQQASMRG